MIERTVQIKSKEMALLRDLPHISVSFFENKKMSYDVLHGTDEQAGTSYPFGQRHL